MKKLGNLYRSPFCRGLPRSKTTPNRFEQIELRKFDSGFYFGGIVTPIIAKKFVFPGTFSC